jgi:penicillin amidase
LLTTPVESCADVARIALDRALDDLTQRQGKNMAKWQWERLHRTQYPHNPFSQVDAFKPLFHRQTGNGGNCYTVNVAPVDYERPYLQFHVPSYRHIVDLADMDNSVFMHTTGQSGNVLSRHYDDLIERHQAVEYLPMTFGRDSVSGDVLILEPN